MFADLANQSESDQSLCVIYLLIVCLLKKSVNTFVRFEKVLRTVAHPINGLESAFTITHVLVVNFVKRRVFRFCVVHGTPIVFFTQTLQRFVRFHLSNADCYPVDLIAHGMQFVTDRHVRKGI